MGAEIKYTPDFEKELKRLAKKYPSIYDDLAILIKDLESNPHMGVSLGHNLYKIRMVISRKGKGKSGSGRVITYVLVNNETVYLASIYDKSDYSTIDIKILIKRLKSVLP